MRLLVLLLVGCILLPYSIFSQKSLSLDESPSDITDEITSNINLSTTSNPLISDTLNQYKVKAGDLINHDYTPLIMKLSEDGKKFVRFIVWNQMWARYTDHNPGTVKSDGSPLTSGNDISLRRSRVLIYAQVSPRFLLLTHFGINNQSFFSGGGRGQGVNVNSNIPIDGKKPQIFIHDAWNEYMVVKDKLYIGSGIHYWLGISRLTNSSTLNFMTLDAPIFNWPLIELSDQFARQLGVYAKGDIGKIHYRAAVNKPFTVFGTNPGINRAVDVANYNLAYTYYVEYQLKSRESNVLPYKVGTYLGTKEVFNIGFGGYHTKDGTGSLSESNGAINLHNINLFGLDVFYEKPIGKGQAINVYAVYYKYNFGPNYIRNVGLLNYGLPGPESRTFNGPGNAQPLIGTGDIAYIQTGYLFPKLKNSTQLMPYATVAYKNFERLDDPSVQFDIGVNYFINGHNAKITLQYSRRPLYEPSGALNGGKGEFILQSHIFL
jgi:hypothetical protein